MRFGSFSQCFLPCSLLIILLLHYLAALYLGFLYFSGYLAFCFPTTHPAGCCCAAMLSTRWLEFYTLYEYYNMFLTLDLLFLRVLTLLSLCLDNTSFKLDLRFLSSCTNTCSRNRAKLSHLLSWFRFPTKPILKTMTTSTRQKKEKA